MKENKENSTWKTKVLRGKHYIETANKMINVKEEYSSNHSSESNRRKTVGVTIRPKLLAQARDMKINLSKPLEKSLKQLIQTQNNRFLSEPSFDKEGSVVGRTGFEPATFCTSSRCPNRTRRPALQPF